MIGGVRVGKYTKGGRRYDIRVSLAEADRSRPEDIDKIQVRNNRGEVIRLSEVIERSERKNPAVHHTRRTESAQSACSRTWRPANRSGEALEEVKRLGSGAARGLPHRALRQRADLQ